MPKNRTSACGRMLEHVLPPNVPADTMQGIIVGSLAIGTLTAAIDFTVHYAATYRGMFYWDGRLMDTALMGPFSAYVEPVVIVFGVVVLLALLSAVMLYSSYYLGGRSIYLMRRLPMGGRPCGGRCGPRRWSGRCAPRPRRRWCWGCAIWRGGSSRRSSAFPRRRISSGS